jgi:hypothetical protein
VNDSTVRTRMRDNADAGLAPVACAIRTDADCTGASELHWCRLRWCPSRWRPSHQCEYGQQLTPAQSAPVQFGSYQQRDLGYPRQCAVRIRACGYLRQRWFHRCMRGTECSCNLQAQEERTESEWRAREWVKAQSLMGESTIANGCQKCQVCRMNSAYLTSLGQQCR